jgi:hypothetical protein
MFVKDDKAREASRLLREALEAISDADPFAVRKAIDAIAYALDCLDPPVPPNGGGKPLEEERAA